MDIPVCGNDKFLYRNYCSLLIEQCKKNEYINIINYGTCPSKNRKNKLRNYFDRLTSF
jgi:hypothetical protein